MKILYTPFNYYAVETNEGLIVTFFIFHEQSMILRNDMQRVLNLFYLLAASRRSSRSVHLICAIEEYSFRSMLMFFSNFLQFRESERLCACNAFCTYSKVLVFLLNSICLV